MDKRFCFEVVVAFRFKVPNLNKILDQSATYNIVANTKDEAMDIAIDLNKTEYSNSLAYQYKGCAATKKTLVYISK